MTARYRSRARSSTSQTQVLKVSSTGDVERRREVRQQRRGAATRRWRPGLRAEPLEEAWINAGEAIGFALLVDRTVRDLSGNVPGAPGAAGNLTQATIPRTRSALPHKPRRS